MKLNGDFQKGIFIDRPNRFLTRVQLGNQIVFSHLPDPGRLQELLIPGAVVWLRTPRKNANRKTLYTTVIVEHNNILISLDSTLPNRFLNTDINKIPFYKGWKVQQSEIQVGNHRFDFLMRDDHENEVITELKSVTFVHHQIAQFPDAVTVRGRKHADALASLAIKGHKTQILFICQRPDAEQFRPMWDRDPAFSAALQQAGKTGVGIRCISTLITKKEMIFLKELQVNLNPPHEN